MQTLLGQPNGPRELEEWFSGVIRDGRLGELEAFLETELRAHADPIAELCLSIPASSVSIVGWDGLYADYLEQERRGNADRPITAIGLDLSAHCEPDGADWGLEASFYDDSAYAFSADNLAEINELASKGSSPWQGCFRDLTHSLSLSGLGTLYARLEASPRPRFNSNGQPVDVATAAIELGWLFLTLRFHQALTIAITAQGMPKPLVVLGGAHDVPPYLEVAYWCDTVTRDMAAGATVLANKDADRKAELRSKADEEIADWRMRRDVIVNNKIRSDKRAIWVDYCVSRDAVLRISYELGEGPPVHELDDHEFELLLHKVRCHYASRLGEDPPPPPEKPQPQRRGLMRLFGRRH